MSKLIQTICMLIFTFSVAHSKEIVLRCKKNNTFNERVFGSVFFEVYHDVEIDLAADKLWVDEQILFTIVTKDKRTIFAVKEVSKGVITIRLDRYDGLMEVDTPQGSATANCKKKRKMF
ncbi:hypothetical protein OAY16_04060 [Candidatus Pelagibacter sp.]|nr:hypothetical protein [Candidatus Pelagibacter sp.]